VTHEVNHATIGYFNRKIKNYYKIFDGKLGQGLDTDNTDFDYEELFCYMSGSLIEQICDYIVAKNKEE
jgi:hypothetical protein